jgi:hypothetical protein
MDTITNTAHCMPWTQQYSLEFLLGVELFHERFGTGKVFAVNDERECFCVCFKGAIQIEIAVAELQHLRQPWHVNVAEINERFVQYQTSIDNLQEKLGDARQNLEVMKSEHRWVVAQSVINAPEEVAIILKSTKDQPRH